MEPKAEIYTVTDRFFGMLGLCRRAGKTVHGTEMICSQMRDKRKPVLVIIASDVSENTRKKLTTKSDFYGIPYLLTDIEGEKLGTLLGKTGFLAGVGILDENFARELRGACKRRESSEDGDDLESRD